AAAHSLQQSRRASQQYNGLIGHCFLSCFDCLNGRQVSSFHWILRFFLRWFTASFHQSNDDNEYNHCDEETRYDTDPSKCCGDISGLHG
ncbi:hypothetical protein PFISCL1PPCAC_1151, partial [Pristionchus fissidentatus]